LHYGHNVLSRVIGIVAKTEDIQYFVDEWICDHHKGDISHHMKQVNPERYSSLPDDDNIAYRAEAYPVKTYIKFEKEVSTPNPMKIFLDYTERTRS